jgi:DNA-binding IclR family transcriptional regulator
LNLLLAGSTSARDPLPKYTAKTITESKMQLEKLEKMAQKGIAIEHGEYEPGVAAVAPTAAP